jgi:hypothetical protein
MQIPSYGAAPISATFLIARGLQLAFLIIILGMTANFVNAMVMADHNPSKEIVGALVIVCTHSLPYQKPTNTISHTDIPRHTLHPRQHILLLGQRPNGPLRHGRPRLPNLHRLRSRLSLHRPSRLVPELLPPLPERQRRCCHRAPGKLEQSWFYLGLGRLEWNEQEQLL